MRNSDITPSYNRIEIPLPSTFDCSKVEAVIYFYVDTRFTTDQTQRIRDTIVRVFIAMNQHFTEKEPSPYLSKLAMCSQRYATRNLTPFWSKGPCITSGTEAANLAMNTLAKFLCKVGSSRNYVPKIDYYLPKPGEHFNIRSHITKKLIRCNTLTLSVTINPQMIGDLTITDLSKLGSLLHAWLHGIGFTHPKDIYTTYFIAEAPMCVMRGYQNKVPSQSDTVYTQYFD